MKLKPLSITFLLLGISLSACGATRPPITFSAYDYDLNIFHATDPHGRDFDIPPVKAHKYICVAPEDFQKLDKYVSDLEKKEASH